MGILSDAASAPVQAASQTRSLIVRPTVVRVMILKKKYGPREHSVDKNILRWSYLSTTFLCTEQT